MSEVDWSDRAFYDDGEWVTWTEIDAHLRGQEREALYGRSDHPLIPIFEDLLELARDYHAQTGLHLSVYGDLGELFGAIAHGIALNRTYAQGSDGRIGNDHVEVKTITPFKSKDVVIVDRARNFNKLLVVKIDADFAVSGRMIDRKALPKRPGRYQRIRWSDLPA
ncbi:MAG: hypothetical protein KDK12_20230 [Rhodobacteraceae bacterium]|nr:hypothetical protein [Paracoccaceae bacterium]